MKKMIVNDPEPKPEIIKNLDKKMLDQNKQELMSFFNISPKTKTAITVSALGVILFFVSIYTVSFQNASFDTLYPKEQSQASQQLTTHTPITGPGFMFVGTQQAQVNQPYQLVLEVNTGTESATIMASQVRFDPAFFEVQTVLNDQSIVKDWIDNNVSNSEGVISLVGSFPRGIIAKPGDQIARLTLLPKKTGITTISIDQKNSHIYRLRDKTEISIQYDQIQVEIN